MRWDLVRAVALCLLLPAFGRPSYGQEATAKPATAVPAQFLKILKDSKLRYEIRSEPVEKPVEDPSCDSRSSGLRAVVDGQGARSLQVWETSKEAALHFEAAEKLFGEKNFSEAAEEYRKLLALDPDFGPGWLFAGDIPYGKGDYEAALKDYRKAIALDFTLPQAHRFAGDALLKIGRLDDAETEYVRAITFDPSYEGGWQGLQVLGHLVGFTVHRPDFSPPEKTLGERQGNKIQIMMDEKQPEWLGYILCKAVWRNEENYRRQRQEGQAGKDYSWSTREEHECLASYLEANWNLAGGDSVKLPALARHLAEVNDAGLLDGFIAVAVLGKRCPLAAALLPDAWHDEAERYVRTFVIVRPPASREAPVASPPQAAASVAGSGDTIVIDEASIPDYNRCLPLRTYPPGEIPAPRDPLEILRGLSDPVPPPAD